MNRYDEAIQVFNEAIKIEPGFLLAVYNLADALYMAGRPREALEMLKLNYQTMGIPLAVDVIEKGMTDSNYKEVFLNLAKALEKHYNESYFLPFEIAVRFIQSGDNARAIYWLEVGFEKRDQNMPYLLCYPFFTVLRDEPRFQEIARKMNLPYKTLVTASQ